MTQSDNNTDTPRGEAFRKLSSKHKKFLLLYLRQGPAWYDKEMAALKAGYAPKCAREQGVRILARPDVRAAMAEMEQAVCDDAALEIEEFERIVCQKIREQGGKDWSVAAGLYAKMRGIDKPDTGSAEASMPLPSAFADVIAAQARAKQQDTSRKEGDDGKIVDGDDQKQTVLVQETAVTRQKDE